MRLRGRLGSGLHGSGLHGSKERRGRRGLFRLHAHGPDVVRAARAGRAWRGGGGTRPVGPVARHSPGSNTPPPCLHARPVRPGVREAPAQPAPPPAFLRQRMVEEPIQDRSAKLDQGGPISIPQLSGVGMGRPAFGVRRRLPKGSRDEGGSCLSAQREFSRRPAGRGRCGNKHASPDVPYPPRTTSIEQPA